MSEDRIYEDRASGREDHRPGLGGCLEALQPANTLVVWKLDRLGHEPKHLVTMLYDPRARGVAGPAGAIAKSG